MGLIQICRYRGVERRFAQLSCTQGTQDNSYIAPTEFQLILRYSSYKHSVPPGLNRYEIHRNYSIDGNSDRSDIFVAMGSTGDRAPSGAIDEKVSYSCGQQLHNSISNFT